MSIGTVAQQQYASRKDAVTAKKQLQKDQRTAVSSFNKGLKAIDKQITAFDRAAARAAKQAAKAKAAKKAA